MLFRTNMVVLLALACVGAGAWAQSPADTGNEGWPKFLAAGVDHYCSAVSSGYVTATKEVIHSSAFQALVDLALGQDAQAGPTRSETAANWQILDSAAGAHLHEARVISQRPRTILVGERWLYEDATVYYRQDLRVERPDGTSTNVVYGSIGSALSDAPEAIANLMWCDPRLASYAAPLSLDLQLRVDGLLTSGQYSAKVIGQETQFGATCQRLELISESGSVYRLWLDVVHGFLPRRVEFVGRDNGRIAVTKTATIPSVSDSLGVWLATRVDVEGQKWLPANGPNAISNIENLLVKHGADPAALRRDGDYIVLPLDRTSLAFRLYAVPPAGAERLLDWTWPAGARVSDTQKAQQMEAGKDGTLAPAAGEHIEVQEDGDDHADN